MSFETLSIAVIVLEKVSFHLHSVLATDDHYYDQPCLMMDPIHPAPMLPSPNSLKMVFHYVLSFGTTLGRLVPTLLFAISEPALPSRLLKPDRLHRSQPPLWYVQVYREAKEEHCCHCDASRLEVLGGQNKGWPMPLVTCHFPKGPLHWPLSVTDSELCSQESVIV